MRKVRRVLSGFVFAHALLAGCASDFASDADAGTTTIDPDPEPQDPSDREPRSDDPMPNDDPPPDAPVDPADEPPSDSGSAAEPMQTPVDAGAAEPTPAAPDAGMVPIKPQPAPPFELKLPPGFPRQFTPKTNPTTAAKAELGRRLFYDKRLSDNQTQSCASCHKQELAFTDALANSVGSTGDVHPRSSMSLANIAYSVSLTWANSLFAMGVQPEPLERQTVLPLYGDAPTELGLRQFTTSEQRLRAVPEYRTWFAEAFPTEKEPLTSQNVGRALAAFERTLISGRSPFDRYFYDHDASVISDAAKRGFELFSSDRLSCSRCHSGFNFSDHVYYDGAGEIELNYHNTGLYNVDGKGGYPEPNTGLNNVSMLPEEMGLFKAPTLRNIEVTAPYMHDGSLESLDRVIDHYAAGGRTITEGPHAGVGSQNPFKDPLVHGFTISAAERAELIAFLKSLTDREFLENPAFADPWK